MPIFLTNLLLLFTLTISLGQTEQPNLQISHLTDDFYVFTTYKTFKGNPFPSNGMYVVSNNGVVMIDTPWDTTQFQPLLDSIQARHHKAVTHCIATHSHEDRTGGLEYYHKQGIKTFTTQQTDEICRERGEKRAAFTIWKDTIFTIGQHSLQTFYAGPGHTPDNIVIWFEKERVLYGGCLIKSMAATDLGNLADANTKAWPRTLKKIQHKFAKPKYIIPGHQRWDSIKSIDHTLALLRELEKKNDR